MKFLLAFSAVFLLVNSCLSAPSVNPNDLTQKSSFDLLLNLLPLYGGIKLNRMINQRSIDLVRQFFEKNTNHYESFRTELRSEGVFLPEIQSVNWNAITSEDFTLAKLIVGETTIKQAIEPTFIEYVVNYVTSDQALVDRLLLRVAQIGITYQEPIDEKRLLDTLGKTFIPMIPDFLPTAITIAILGKRETSDIESGNDKETGTPMGAIVTFSKFKTFIQSNPELVELLNRLDINWSSVIQTAIQVLPTLISVLGK